MTDRRNWNDIKKPRSKAAQRAYDDEARISEFREIVYRVRTEAGLIQAELAERMGTTQSAVARIEGGWNPTPVWKGSRSLRLPSAKSWW